MDLESGLLLFFIGIPFSVGFLALIIKFIGATEKRDNDEDSEDINRFKL